jgi:exodeoxyribonuclease VII small subunit
MAETNSNSAKSKAHGENSATFEENFARLQQVVAKLSEGNLTLQEALSAYEEGMSLAERCARMLDEAELRVKQVSERAMRAGSAALAELDEQAHGFERNGDQGLVAIEIETFESTLRFSDAPAQKQQAGDPEPHTQKKPLARPVARPAPDDLDPLFDEDE